MSTNHSSFMQAAIDEARAGLAEGGIPIGSVIVYEGLHGEMDAFENAGRQPASVYRQATLYTTLSPCSMCSGAILLYGIKEVIIGENSTFMGEEALLKSRGVHLQVLQDPDCIKLMNDFIADNPKLWNEDIGL